MVNAMPRALCGYGEHRTGIRTAGVGGGDTGAVVNDGEHRHSDSR